jgi:putative membrane protein
MLGGLPMVLFWGAVIVLVVFAVRALAADRSSTRHDHANNQSSTAASAPLEILQMRYVKGEIGKEEYERARRDLQAIR